MTAAELHSLAATTYGARWQSQLARDMNIALRTIQRWSADGIHKPATAEGVRRFLEERRVARIAPPPAGSSAENDRDDACRDALEPGMTALLTAAVDVGWHPGEAMVAMLADIIDRMRDSAGDAATAETLQSALGEIARRSAR